MRTYEVGGAIRDSLLGIESKDVDFAVEAESFEAMRDELIAQGFKVFLETPEFFTVRAKPPAGSKLAERTNVADFVLCRKDGPSSDGRRPDFVEAGTILDDLARRDFTVNAIARDVDTDELVDPFGGQRDLANRCLRFVGDPDERIREDGLRVLRAFRFMITKGLSADPNTLAALRSPLAIEMLGSVSIERVREELVKMFATDTLSSLNLFAGMSEDMQQAIFRDGLRLTPTLAERIK